MIFSRDTGILFSIPSRSAVRTSESLVAVWGGGARMSESQLFDFFFLAEGLAVLREFVKARGERAFSLCCSC